MAVGVVLKELVVVVSERVMIVAVSEQVSACVREKGSKRMIE